jgi:4-amino-4-deoxy-L-arabinose transferase-like glycosyltransferase
MAVMVFVMVITPDTVVPVSSAGPVEPPPLSGLDRIADFFHEYMSTWIVAWPIVSLLALAGVGFAGWRAHRRPQAVRVATLLAVLCLALEGELLLLEHVQRFGLVLFIAAALGFGLWLVAYRPAPQHRLVEVRRMGWREAALLVLVLLMAAFGRYFALDRFPYGIEGDESKWTVEVVSVMLDGQHTIQSDFHYGTQPVSFYMQAPFHYLLGPGIATARIAVATYSLVATLLFYWLVRETLGVRAALLSTLLMSVALADVSASRLALVETHVKIWAVAGLAFLARGLRLGQPLHSFLGGLAIAVGLLTYDTFAPMVVVVVVWTIVSLAAQRAPVRGWVFHLSALLLPIVAVTPFVAEYLLGRMGYYTRGEYDWTGAPIGVFGNNLLLVLENFGQAHNDFLIARDGPIVNALLTPFLVVGLVLGLARIRRPAYALPALWFVLLFFPVPIYTGHPVMRVFYPGLPAVYVLIALAALFVWRELMRAFPASLHTALVALAALSLIWLVPSNVYLYFNTTRDPTDRQVRREIADLVTQAVAPGSRVHVPHLDESDDPALIEQPLFLMEVRRRMSRDQVAQRVWVGDYGDLLPTVARDGPLFENLAFVIHRRTAAKVGDGVLIVDALERCLSVRLEQEGQWFDLYVVDAFDIEAARCIAPRVVLEGPFPARPETDQPVELRWRMEDAAGPGEALLECEQLQDGTVALEAEDLDYDTGWYEDRGAVEGFRGRGYLVDRLQAANARGTVWIDEAGVYDLWARTYCHSADTHLLHVRVDERSHTLPPCAAGGLSEWTWSRLGSFPLGTGAHSLRMARVMRGPSSRAQAILVDSLVLSTDSAFDPMTTTPWMTLLETGESVPAHVSSGVFQLGGLPRGEHRCWVTIVDGERLVDWNGEVGARSNRLEFRIPSDEGEDS